MLVFARKRYSRPFLATAGFFVFFLRHGEQNKRLQNCCTDAIGREPRPRPDDVTNSGDLASHERGRALSARINGRACAPCPYDVLNMHEPAGWLSGRAKLTLLVGRNEPQTPRIFYRYKSMRKKSTTYCHRLWSEIMLARKAAAFMRF